MKYSKLMSKTSKQLKNFLYRYGWNKENLFWEYIVTDMEDVFTLTFEQLCEKYHDEIIDFIWEEMCNA